MKVLSLLVFVVVSTGLYCQSIWTNPITGTNPNTSNPYTTGQTFSPNITVSGISRGTGATGTNANDRYNANSWNTASIDLTAYFEWTLTPNSSFCLNFSSFVYTSQRSASGPTIFAFRSSLDGFVSNIGTVNSTGATIDLSSIAYQGINSSITFRLYAWGASGSTGTFSINDFTFNGTTSCGPPANTITTGSISGSPFSVDCTAGAAGSIDFTSTGTFNASNSYTAQLSDASGNFASPTNIGSLNSTANTGSIPITIPSGTASGAGYLIRIVSSDPAITGSNSGSFTVTLSGGPCTLTPPYMTSLIYDGCNVTCSGSSTEGRSEIIFGNTGDYSVAVNPTNVRFIYNTNGNQPLTSGIVNNAATTANLNTEAGCPGLFLDGFGQTLSPNTSFLVVSENLCISSLIWSDLCGSGPIYVLYASSSPTTWNDGGNFGNTAGTRNLQTIITATDGSVHDISYSYTSVNGGDGSYATWTSAGGTPATSGIFSNCRLTPVALPTGITFFKATFYEPNNQLFWQSHSEQNNDFYTLQHSTDGLNYYEIGITQGAGNSSSLINYSFSHNRPPRGINYYKLTSTDYDGTTYYKGITAVMVEGEGTYFDPLTSQLKFNETSDYSIYTAEGKLILSIVDQDSVNFDYHGMIIIQDHRKLSVERIFVP